MYRNIQILIAIFGLFYMAGALTFLLTPQGADSSPLFQQIGILLGVYALLDLVRINGKTKVALERYAAILLLVAYAAFSILWAVDPDLATKRVGALFLTFTFGVWLAESFRASHILNLMLAALVAACIASFVAIFVFPEFGIHQATNVINEESVGAWRGMYNHKNDFGRMAALTVVLGTVMALNRRKGRLYYVAIVGMALVLVAGSVSSQAILLSILGAGTAVLAMFLRWRTAAERAMVLLFLVPFSIVAVLLANIVATSVLGALGKDFTFSDRTEIWSLVINGIQDRVLLGGGYGSGWEMVSEAINQRFGRSIGHAHNGFLMMVVNVGLLGAFLTTLIFLYSGAIAFAQMMRGRQVLFACFWLAYQVYFLIGNLAASFALEYSTLDFVLLTVAMVALRQQERPLQRSPVVVGQYPSVNGARPQTR